VSPDEPRAASRPPDAVAPPPGHRRFPLFDSLRALAALSVLLVHTSIFSGALEGSWYRPLVAHLDIGVTIFFLLSGFLLYRPFLAARVLGSPGIRGRDYARRRFLRIAPAYWLALTVLAVFPGVYGVFTGNWWVYYGLLQNYPVYGPVGGCEADVLRCGIAPTWSLAIEVGFYAVLPLFALAMGAIVRRARLWLGVELAVLGAIAIVSVWIQGSDLDTDLSRWLFFSPLGRGWWFGLGMGLAAVSVWAERRGSEPSWLRWPARRPTLIWTTALALYAGMCLLVLEPRPSLGVRFGVSRAEYIGQYLVFGLIAALILLPAVFGDRDGGLPRRILRHPALAWLGLVSYGIFLWHFPILVGLHDGGVADWWPAMAFPLLALLTLAITILCAALSYYLVERPLMRWK
jgi:peptidoglycan/LPS O-acetylase OafA/YrhL